MPGAPKADERRRTLARALGGALALLVVLQARPVRAGEVGVLGVVVNGDDKGSHFALLEEDGDVLLPEAELGDMGFRETPAAVERGGKRWVSLRSMPEGVRFRLDEASGDLVVTVDPRLLVGTTTDLGAREAPAPQLLEGFSAILNYDVAFRTADDFRSGALSVPAELGVRVSDLLFHSGFSYARTAAGEATLSRLLTSVTRDEPSRQRRLVVGDFVASSGPLGGAAILAGVSLSKEFSLSPRFVRGPRIDLAGMVTTPSDVEVYVNGVLVRRERVPPGELRLTNVPPVAGAGVATVVIRDAFGREERLTSAYYLTPSLLAPGLAEYGYHLGLKREGLGLESARYEGLAFLGFHRLGLTRALTVGLRAEADRDAVGAGASATFAAFGAGEVDAALAASRSGGRSGAAGSLAWSYAGGALGGGASLTWTSPGYASMSLLPSRERPRLELSATFGFQLRPIGSLTVTGSASDGDRRRVSVLYGRTVAGSLSLQVTAGRTWGETTIDEVFAGLSFPLGERASGSAGHQSQGSTTREVAQVQESPPFGGGLGYRVSAERRAGPAGEAGFAGGGAIQYKGARGVCGVEVGRSGGEDTVGLEVAGGLVLAGGSLHASRPVPDSFAVVEVQAAEEVRVYQGGQKVGVARSGEPLVVPTLLSHDGNRISIDERDLPVDLRLPVATRNVTTGWRGGGVVRFEGERVRAFVGRMTWVDGEKRVPAEYALLEIEAASGRVESVVGKGGELYLENLPVGRLAGKATLDGRECTFQLDVPPIAKGMVVVLGEVDCVGR